MKVSVVAEAAPSRTLAYSGVVRSRIESAVGFRVAGKIVERPSTWATGSRWIR